jgi:hypothetical protein
MQPAPAGSARLPEVDRWRYPARCGPSGNTGADEVEIVRAIAVIGLAAAMLAVAVELLLPASGRFVGWIAAGCGVAAWILPILLVALDWNRKPTRAFAGVGFAIRIVLVAGALSAIAAAFALATLVFGPARPLAWFALAAVAAFWIAGAATIAVGVRLAERRRARSR